MSSLATIIRPMMIEQDVLFTCLGLLVLTPITLVSGGVNSQFAYLLPIIPIFIALVGNAKYTWITAFIVIVLIIGLYFSVGVFPDLTIENVPQNKTASSAIWLCLSVFLSTTLGVEFNRIYGALGDKISEQAETDLLTDLKNRRSVMSFLQIAIDQAKRKNCQLSVMMIDLEHFKNH